MVELLCIYKSVLIVKDILNFRWPEVQLAGSPALQFLHGPVHRQGAVKTINPLYPSCLSRVCPGNESIYIMVMMVSVCRVALLALKVIREGFIQNKKKVKNFLNLGPDPPPFKS